MDEIKQQYEAFVEKWKLQGGTEMGRAVFDCSEQLKSELQDLMRAVGVKFAEYCQIREHDPDEELFTEFINQLK